MPNTISDRTAADTQGQYRVGVDIGGTFTDAVLLDPATGHVSYVKVPTVPGDPGQGFLNGLDEAVGKNNVPIADIAFLAHGTTIATNTLIEGKQCRVGLITSEGFSDVLEIAYQTRPDLFDLLYDKPVPLVARHMAIGVPERIGAEGEVFVALDEHAVAREARRLRDAGADAIVVSFLHSYRFPAHERRAGRVIAEVCPEVEIILSSDVCPEYHEYPRTSTATVNAALLPRVGGYIRGLDGALKERGMVSPLHLMTSAGGIMSAENAAKQPVQLIESGPAATVIGGAFVAGLSGLGDIMVFDMGGTTAKVAVVQDGTPRTTDQFEVGHMAVANDTAGRGRGYPVRTRTIEMVEVGAGGGSIAALDPGGALGIGPESMGADPGPACYGQGGDRPTITDANLVLGRLNPDYFLAGAKALRRDRSIEVIQSQIAEPMGYDLIRAAHAIIEIGNARMAAAMEMMSIRRGVDPREYVMVACGGGGPLHAAAIARRIGAKRVLIPPMPGLTAALGLVSTDLKHEFTRNIMRRPDEIEGSDLSAQFAELVETGREILLSENVAEDAMLFQCLADVSYLGQSFQLRIALPGAEVTQAILTDLVDRFHARHKELYGFSSPEERTLIVSVRVVATGHIARPRLEPVASGGSDGSAAKKGERLVHLSVDSSEAVACTIYERSLLRIGDVFAGPAIIEQMDTTTLVPEGATVELDDIGNLLITV